MDEMLSYQPALTLRTAALYEDFQSLESTGGFVAFLRLGPRSSGEGTSNLAVTEHLHRAVQVKLE